MPSKLRDIRIHTIGLVREGENKGGRVVLCKRKGTDMSPEEMQAAMEAIQAKLDDAEKAKFLALLEAMKAPAQPGADVAAKSEEEEKPDVVAKQEEEPDAITKQEEEKEDEEASGGAPAALAKAKADLAAARADLAKAQDAERLRVYVAKASAEMIGIPGVLPEQLGVLLKSTQEQLGDAAYDDLCRALTSASTAISKSALLQSAGSGQSDQAGSPMSRLDGAITQLRKAKPELSREKALYEVARSNPAIFHAAAKE